MKISNKGIPLEMRECTFKGNFENGYHYIDGENLENNSPKLVVKKCRFLSSMDKALNLDKYNEYLSIDFKDQVFDLGTLKESKKSSSTLVIGAAVVVPVAVIALIVGIVIFFIKRKNPNAFNETEMTAETRDVLLDESLI